ncbi:MAG: phosphate signaling complex protein PhoU [Dehalococcoides mccartyi]|jgi:phosphate transport system regulatory protein PhoU|uniref:Phosphate-specific transport system accessory protein PhoU n=3 Tax=root TaxID=1 RepID=A0A0V8M3W1_9CHLR|nr:MULTISPECIES: phosphate signaling complex protein PhoU [Dehalococcoides]AAW40521.1 phosphate transport system regulatory protein PhoU [Dehalococcoides mccartyi 195]AII58915.1 PhoU family transcriptional regulator [Dehalococcoides mccartyi CG4]AQU02632.1 phosphate transport system regulatory protein PhoU [Dehalococcoides mccartyi]AQU03967.1 phosphate transport system regulatory protein PhoU [Dehalococcoides mccartyi]KSV18438.1 PhoU family transcriptional regulator [Dehalococcoides mccartyi]
MPRMGFDRHLRELEDDMLLLGSMVGKAVDRSMQSMKERDLELAKQVIEEDKLINQKRFEIEEKSVELMATQQPMARDLRIIVAVLNIIVDLERIGDHAEGNAKIALMLGEEPPLKPLIDLPRMASKTEEMLNRALGAFVRRDSAEALRVIDEDDEVDGLYNQIFRELLVFMAEDPHTISRATRLIWAAHNLERSADRVTNICERVLFVITGKSEEFGSSKY